MEERSVMRVKSGTEKKSDKSKSKKKKYLSPKLQSYGSVLLNTGGASGGLPDGGSGMAMS